MRTAQALVISHSRNILRRLGCCTVAVLNEDQVDTSGFAAKHWNGRLVLDEPLAFYHAFGGGQPRKGDMKEFLKPSLQKIWKTIVTQGVKGTPKSGVRFASLFSFRGFAETCEPIGPMLGG